MHRTPQEHTSLISTSSLLADALESYGLDSNAIAREAGIEPERAYDPNGRLPVAKLQRVWQLAVERSGDPCFGLTFANLIQPAALHGLGLAWLSSSSLAEALQRLIRYQRLISTVFDISLERDNEQTHLHYSLLNYGTTPAPASIDASLASTLRMCRITAGNDTHPVAVAISHSRPACHDRFREFFQAPLTFEADENRLSFDNRLIDQPLKTANPELARINDRVVIDYLKRFDKSDLTLQVRSQIIEQLPSGLPHQEVVARSLHMSLRNLQRKLNDLGTSYKMLLDETRMELAIQYLTGSSRSIIEIGLLLGFSEPSNFSRAFRRWTGEPPQHYRQNLQ